MTFVLISTVYACGVTKPGHGSLTPLAVGLSLVACAGVGERSPQPWHALIMGLLPLLATCMHSCACTRSCDAAAMLHFSCCVPVCQLQAKQHMQLQASAVLAACNMPYDALYSLACSATCLLMHFNACLALQAAHRPALP
jgi:hypothetical protein